MARLPRARGLALVLRRWRPERRQACQESYEEPDATLAVDVVVLYTVEGDTVVVVMPEAGPWVRVKVEDD